MHLVMLAIGVYAVVSVVLLVTFCWAAAATEPRPGRVIHFRPAQRPAAWRAQPVPSMSPVDQPAEVLTS
jgi:hypothetical protein